MQLRVGDDSEFSSDDFDHQLEIEKDCSQDPLSENRDDEAGKEQKKRTDFSKEIQKLKAHLTSAPQQVALKQANHVN